MKKILERWKKYAKKNEDRNYYFIRSLKMKAPRPVDKLAKELHEEAFQKIDCTNCANCCKTISPLVTEKDSRRIARHFNMGVDEFKTQYLEKDREGDWLIKGLPCPFLGEDDKCTIYDVRPKDCREYPHANKKGFARRSHGHTANTLVCPAVF